MVKDINRLKIIAASSHKYCTIIGLRPFNYLLIIPSYRAISSQPSKQPTNPFDPPIPYPPRLYLTIALSPSSSTTKLQ
jgi:hypothetical protein